VTDPSLPRLLAIAQAARPAAGEATVPVAGGQIPAAELERYVCCRPGKPHDGCQGRGFIEHAAAEGRPAWKETCYCVEKEFRRQHSLPPVYRPTPGGR
jgi:hypothetical protein